MKLIKVVSAAVAATLILGAGISANAAHAKLSISNIVPVTIALTLQQQSYSSAGISSYTNTYSYTTVKLTNKDILALLADIAGVSSWPVGTKLGYDGNELVVVGKKGNVLLYASCGGEFGGITFEPYYSDSYVSSGTYAELPDSYNYSEHYIQQGYLSIYDDNYYYMDISGYGLTQADESYDSSTSKGSEAIVFQPVAVGYWDDNYNSILTGAITVGGKYNSGK